MKARRKRNLLVLNSKTYQNFSMSNLITFQKFSTFLAYKSKVPVIRKWSKSFFLNIFTWFDRARRALQNCIY